MKDYRTTYSHTQQQTKLGLPGTKLETWLTTKLIKQNIILSVDMVDPAGNIFKGHFRNMIDDGVFLIRKSGNRPVGPLITDGTELDFHFDTGHGSYNFKGIVIEIEEICEDLIMIRKTGPFLRKSA